MEKLLAMSKSFVINLDIGHFAAGNNDVLAFLKKHHERIAHLHVKDRKRDKGPNVQLGTGDTPITESATLIRDERWPNYADPRARVSRCAGVAGRANALAVELSKGVTRKISPRRRCDEALSSWWRY